MGSKIALAAFLVLIFCLYASGLTSGMEPDATDWAMYVMHARNLVTGHAYADTGYVTQPETIRQQGASTYPSGYPLLLAPFYAAFGLNIHVFKLLNDVFLVLSFWPVFLLARRTLSIPACFLIITILAFSEPCLALYNTFGSDAPYQLLSFVVLLFLQRIYDHHWCDKFPVKWGIISGLLIAAVYLMRPVGLVVLLSVAALELVRKRRPTLFLATVLLAFVPPLLLNNLLFHKDAGYSDQFALSIPAMLSHTARYFVLFSYAFSNPLSHTLRYVIWALATPLAAAGLFFRIRRGPTLAEYYFFGMLAVLSFYWMPNARYLLPILPIFLIYVLEGFQALLAHVTPRLAPALSYAAAVLLLLPSAASAVTLRSADPATLITAPLYEQLCRALREQTSPAGMVVFWNPRVLVLSTGRRASDYPPESPDRLIVYLERVHPDYIVVDKDSLKDREYLIPVLASSGLKTAILYESSEFRLLRVSYGPADRENRDSAPIGTIHGGLRLAGESG